jgi:hypothetical protein
VILSNAAYNLFLQISESERPSFRTNNEKSILFLADTIDLHFVVKREEIQRELCDCNNEVKTNAKSEEFDQMVPYLNTGSKSKAKYNPETSVSIGEGREAWILNNSDTIVMPGA